MSKELIPKLKTLLNEGGSKEKIEGFEEVIGEEIEEYVEEELFYELPTKEILKIIDKSSIEDIELISTIITRMRENKQEESTLLLNVIKSNETTLDECIQILSKFEHCPICKRTSDLFHENSKLPEQDYEYEILELKKEIEELQNKSKENDENKNKRAEIKEITLRKEIKTFFSPVTEKPSDFESDICKAAEEGKLTSVQFLVERYHVNAKSKRNCGCTPMKCALRNGHLEVVKYLYEACCVDLTDEDIRESKTKEIKEYFSAIFEDKPSGFDNDIYRAAKKGNLTSVQYLVERYHFDIETKDNDGCTPMKYAIQNERLEIVKYLYETCHSQIDDDAIQYASQNRHLEVVKYLKQYLDFK